MKQLLSLIVTIISFTSYAQIYSELISDEEILDFLKWESKNTPITTIPVRTPFFKMVYYKPVSWGYVLVIPDSILQETGMKAYNPNIFLNKFRYDLDTILTKGDIEFIQSQYRGHNTANKWKIKLTKTFYKRLLFGKNRTYYYTIPVFSLDKNYVLFKKVYYCGPICGEGKIILYKRISDNNWIEYKVLSSALINNCLSINILSA
ncbi:MAG: hypothetical protein K0B10_13160 [Vicingaceae bacterium]|nr:hypothetical protein [Vicingaceae bacterium]